MNKQHDKDWEKIDEIADQNGGHYVVPTTPGEVDTSEVSEFIRKQKAQRASKE